MNIVMYGNYCHFSELSDWNDFVARIKIIKFFIFLIECYHKKVKSSLETTMIAIKNLVIEIHEFECQEETLFQHFLELSAFCDSDAWIKTNEFHLECSSTRIWLPDDALMVEVEAVVSRKIEFEYRDKTKTTAFSQKF